MVGYVITILIGCFWLFRLFASLMYTAGAYFAVTPMNFTFEIVLLIITFICIILIAKRKMIGAVIYLIAQCSYFGIDAYKTLENLIEGQNIDTLSFLTSVIAIILSVLAIMSIGLRTGKKSNLKNKNTDWFYATDEYERKLDERADKNQYKF